MPALLSLPMRRILAPTLYRAMSSGYLVHEPKYSFLKVWVGQGGNMLFSFTLFLYPHDHQDLGIGESNSGVYDGSWKGSGVVSVAVRNNALHPMGSLGSTVVGSPVLLAAPRYGGLAVTSAGCTGPKARLLSPG